MGPTLAIASLFRKWVEGHLLRLGLLDRFHILRCSGDVPRVKPDPALCLAVLEATAVRAVDALALEDSPNGVLAAKRAGLACAAVPNALTARLDLGAADLRLASLADVSLDVLITRALTARRGRVSSRGVVLACLHTLTSFRSRTEKPYGLHSRPARRCRRWA